MEEIVVEEGSDTPAAVDVSSSDVEERTERSSEASKPARSPSSPANAIGLAEWWKKSTTPGDGGDDRVLQFWLIVLTGGLYLTQLNFGLWDCWEPHYAETARMMVVRGDWVHPYWSYAYFLSKPVLMFWYMAASMSVFGVNEWAIRLPFALHAVWMVWVVYFVVSRLFTRRAGLFAAIAVATTPLTVFLGRQAIVDIIVTSYITAGLGFFALAVFGSVQEREAADKEGRLPRVHLPYLYFFYFLMGLTLLAKGMLGAGLAGFVILGYLLLSNDWALLLRVRLVSGVFLTLLIALPWYLHMSFFPGRNIDDHMTFYKRFILHDNIYRLFRGVHGEKGSFVYFIQQLGYALGTWVGLLPVALLSFARFRQPSRGSAGHTQKLHRFMFAWWFCALLLFSLSQTKFHHYVFPVVPISTILIGIWLDRFLSHEENANYRFALLIALGIFGVIFRDVIGNPHHLVNMFVYKYSRPYPWSEPLLLFGIDVKFAFLKQIFLFRPTPQVVLRDIALVVVFFYLSGFFYNARKIMVWGLCGVGAFFAFYNAHSFMINLTPHWSQKHLAETLKKDSPYWKKRLSNKWADGRKMSFPKEPLLAFRMNWRGEKFYFQNQDLQILGTYSYARLYQALKRHRASGHPAYFLIEAKKARMKQLKRAVGKTYAKLLKVIDKTNNKYQLIKLQTNARNEHEPASQVRKDNSNRRYYDDWVRKWRKKERAKKRKAKNVKWKKK